MSAIKKLQIPILLVVLLTLMRGSYFILRLDNINNSIVILITLSLIILTPMSIYFLLIRPRPLPKLLSYLSFLLCLAASYYIIPLPHKGFFNHILVWLLPVLEVCVIIIVIYTIVKTIILYKTNENSDFLDAVRKSLEPKLGKGPLLEIVLTELSVFYYSIVVSFKKPKVQSQGVYPYHKSSQLKIVTIVFSILIVGEGLLFHFLIQIWNDIAAWIFTVLNIYALLYMIGHNNSIKYLPHVIKKGKLIIRLGFQSSIEIDIKNIISIKHAKESELGAKIPKETYISLTKLDSPQFELTLKEPTLMRGSYGKNKYVNTVVFRADEPQKMIKEINSIRNLSP